MVSVLDIKEGKLSVVGKMVTEGIPNKIMLFVAEQQDLIAIGALTLALTLLISINFGT